MISIFIKDIFQGVSKYQIIADFVIPFIFDFVVPVLLGIWLERKHKFTEKIMSIVKFVNKQTGAGNLQSAVQQKSGHDSNSNVHQNKITTFFGKNTIRIEEPTQKIGTEEEAKSIPEALEMKVPAYNGVLDKKQLEVCRKVKDISKKHCGEELDIQSAYELGMLAVNNTEILIAASRFVEMYRGVTRVFLGITKGDNKKDFQEFEQVVTALEQSTRNQDTEKALLKQIEYCEKGIWKLIVSFPL